MKLSAYHVATPAVIDQVDGSSKRVVFATRTATAHVFADGLWQRLLSGAFDDVPADIVSDLERSELLIPDDAQDELKSIVARNIAAAEQFRTCALVVQPTAYCQFGCGYCGQEHQSKWLSAELQDSLCERTAAKLSSGRFDGLDVSWFGAEPLAAMNVIRGMSPRFERIAHDAACTYTASVTTNGYTLTPAIASELVHECSVKSITITLDGLAENHDGRRHLKSGSPTFSRVFSNLVALAKREDLDIEIKVRTNVDRLNCDGVTPLIRRLADVGIQQRIKYYTAPIHSWGNDAHVASLKPDEYARREIVWFCEMLRLGFNLGLLPRRRPIVCVAVQPDAEVVDAEGTVYNCTEAPYVPAYRGSPEFEVGHISDREPVRRRRLSLFNEQVARAELPCATCRMLPVCGGACPKAWMEQQEPCPSAKWNMPERLLLAYAEARQTAETRTGLEGLDASGGASGGFGAP